MKNPSWPVLTLGQTQFQVETAVSQEIILLLWHFTPHDHKGTVVLTVDHTDGTDSLGSSWPDRNLYRFPFSLLLIWLGLYSLGI